MQDRAPYVRRGVFKKHQSGGSGRTGVDAGVGAGPGARGGSAEGPAPTRSGGAAAEGASRDVPRGGRGRVPAGPTATRPGLGGGAAGPRGADKAGASRGRPGAEGATRAGAGRAGRRQGRGRGRRGAGDARDPARDAPAPPSPASRLVGGGGRGGGEWEVPEFLADAVEPRRRQRRCPWLRADALVTPSAPPTQPRRSPAGPRRRLGGRDLWVGSERPGVVETRRDRGELLGQWPGGSHLGRSELAGSDVAGI